jgi:hypothetical protein
MALDIRSRRFGYVIFAGPHTLLDWGIRTHADGERSVLERRLIGLQSMFAPSTILVRKSLEHSQTKTPTIRPAFNIVKSFARRAVVAVRLIDGSILRRFFFRKERKNKDDIARMVADRFPELSWRLPPKRKPWQSEPARQSIFDAASLGVFYFAQNGDGHEHVPLASG